MPRKILCIIKLMVNKQSQPYSWSSIIMLLFEQHIPEELFKTNDGKNNMNNDNPPCDNWDGKIVGKMLCIKV